MLLYHVTAPVVLSLVCWLAFLLANFAISFSLFLARLQLHTEPVPLLPPPPSRPPLPTTRRKQLATTLATCNNNPHAAQVVTKCFGAATVVKKADVKKMAQQEGVKEVALTVYNKIMKEFAVRGTAGAWTLKGSE